VWGIFALQDTALTGLRNAVWVPVENIAYAVIKILLLVLLARTTPQYGIFASWIFPVIITIIPINWLIFRRLIPRHVIQTREQARPIQIPQISKFVIGNFIGSLFLLSSARLLPVLVTNQAGAKAGAYFFMAWTIANSIKLVTTNMTMSLTVEGARDQTHLASYGRRFLLLAGGLFLPLIGAVILAAPLLLRLSGNEYSSEGTIVLRLLALSVIPSIVTAVFISTAQVEHKVAAIVLVQGAFCVLVVGLTLLFLPMYGITGVGFAFLISESLLAAVLLVGQLKPLFVGQKKIVPPQKELSR
jgi:O-antigen/teichoic acid export membrane protein